MIGASVIYLSLLILVFLAMILKWPVHKRKKAVFSLASWVVIIFIIISIYSFRYELTNNRIFASLIPGHGYTDYSNALNFKKAVDGHFYIVAFIKNISIKFLVDTGATDTTLSLKDARKLGLDINGLAYTKRYNTANGIVKAAPITIKKIKIGRFIIENTPVTVNRTEMKHSLLGMSALSDFSISISNDILTIS